MPRRARKRGRSTFRRRRPARRRFTRKRKSFISRLPFTGFGLSKVVRLRYTTPLLINPAVGLAVFHFFRANGPFDPDLTGVGHQPRGYDQWAQFYQRATVLGSRIRVINTKAESANVTPAYYGVWLLRNSADASNMTNLAEMLETKLPHSRLSHGGVVGTNQGKALPSVGISYSPRRFWGQRTMNNNDIQFEVTGLPLKGCVYGVGAAPGNIAADPPNVDLHIVIDYVVKFFEAKTIVPS